MRMRHMNNYTYDRGQESEEWRIGMLETLRKQKKAPSRIAHHKGAMPRCMSYCVSVPLAVSHLHPLGYPAAPSQATARPHQRHLQAPVWPELPWPFSCWGQTKARRVVQWPDVALLWPLLLALQESLNPQSTNSGQLCQTPAEGMAG